MIAVIDAKYQAIVKIYGNHTPAIVVARQTSSSSTIVAVTCPLLKASLDFFTPD